MSDSTRDHQSRTGRTQNSPTNHDSDVDDEDDECPNGDPNCPGPQAAGDDQLELPCFQCFLDADSIGEENAE